MRLRLEELGWSKAELARKVGCAAPTITDILEGKSIQSSLIPKIHKVLDWEPPQLPDESIGDEDPEDALADQAREIFRALPEEARAPALELLRQLAAKRSKNH